MENGSPIGISCTYQNTPNLYQYLWQKNERKMLAVQCSFEKAIKTEFKKIMGKIRNNNNY